MGITKTERLEIRLTDRMKRDIEKAAKEYRTKPSTLMRALFVQFDENEWRPRRSR